jgi:hypothetical protein
MSGRFFNAPFFLGILILCRLPWATGVRWLVAAAVIPVLGMSSSSPTVLVEDATISESGKWAHGPGIADERIFYSQLAGLLHTFPGRGIARSPRGAAGLEMRGKGDYRLHGALGYFSYFAGPTVYIHDLYALTDPLLARIPGRRDVPQRVGHHLRVPPQGYADTLVTGENSIANPATREYYKNLRLVIRGGLLDLARLAAIWEVNHTSPIESDGFYLRPRYESVLGVSLPSEHSDSAKPGRSFSHPGMLIDLGSLLAPSTIELGLGANDGYLMYLLTERGIVMVDQAEATDVLDMGQRVHTILVTELARSIGVNRILVIPYEGDNDYRVTSLRVR